MPLIPASCKVILKTSLVFLFYAQSSSICLAESPSLLINGIKEYKEYVSLIEKQNGIPQGLLSAIISTESAFNPGAINIEGRTVNAKGKAEALTTIKDAISQGITNIDIGLAQINYRWHKDSFRSIEEMLDPKTNIEYAGILLASLYRHHLDWHKAVRYYHSANPEYYKKYSRKIVLSWLKG